MAKTNRNHGVESTTGEVTQGLLALGIVLDFEITISHASFVFKALGASKRGEVK